MPRLTRLQRLEVRKRTESILETLLTFHVSFSGIEFIHDDAVKNWRALEERLHNEYPIKGVGVQATRGNLNIVDGSDGGFLFSEEDLHPGEVPTELQSFPYAAAAAAYTFTLLEGYGDELVGLVNPGALQPRQAWHHGVYGDANLKDPAALEKAKKGFAKPFKLSPAKAPRYAVQRLVDVKAIRNEIMHEGATNVRFPDFFAGVVGTVLSIYFMLLPQEKDISLFPYYDYNGRWGDV